MPSMITEVDVFLENGETVMIARIKTKPRIDDINGRIERIQKPRTHTLICATINGYAWALRRDGF